MHIRNKWLIIVLVLTPLLFTGCFGSRSRTDYTYDGRPTVLEVVIKRDNKPVAKSLTLSAMTKETEQYAHVRIWKENSRGDVIYDTVKRVPLSQIDNNGYKLVQEVPASKGYSITIIYSDTKGYFEVGEQTAVDAPAEHLTTTSVVMAPMEYEIVVPDALYTGGTLNQFEVILPEKYQHIFEVALRYGGEVPWTENQTYSGNYTKLPTDKRMYTIYNPTPIYYQFIISLRPEYHYQRLPHEPWVPTTAYIPNLDCGDTLPFVMAYPEPGAEM